jgi:hypothetical protein
VAVIVRHRHHYDFTVYPNALIRDPHLSFRATGLLVYLLSLPDGSETDSTELARRKREGRDAVRTAYAELIDIGYVVRSRRQDDKGLWTTVIEVSDIPMPGKPSSEGFAPGNPMPGEPTSDGQAVKAFNNRDKKNSVTSPRNLKNGGDPRPSPVVITDERGTFLSGTGWVK